MTSVLGGGRRIHETRGMAVIAALAARGGNARIPIDAAAAISKAMPAQVTIARGIMRTNTSNQDMSTRIVNVPERTVPTMPMPGLSAKAGYE